MPTQEAVMTTQEIAHRLHELCQENKYEEAQRELYSQDAISIEPVQANGFQSVTGLDDIIKKGHHFQEMLEQVHGGSISDPIVAGNHFSLAIVLDATYKGMGRNKMEELAVYEVKDGKIVKEQFFYKA
jgi:hypothetical protein